MWLKDNSFGVVEVFDRWGEEDRRRCYSIARSADVGGRVVGGCACLVGGGDRLALFCILIPTLSHT